MNRRVGVFISFFLVLTLFVIFYESGLREVNISISGKSIDDFFGSFKDETSLSPEQNGGSGFDASAVLGLDDVFINNTNNFVVSNQLASVPITFRENEATDATLYQFVLQDSTGTNLLSQIQPTSYYPKSGSVRTAIAHVKVSLNPGQEVIYRIVRDTGRVVPQFQFHSSINSFLQSGKISAISRDINQVPYKAEFDLSRARLVVDGPLIKIYEYHKAHRPDSSADLTHLGSSVFYITFVSNEPLVRIQHLWVNTHNLDELTRTRGANNEWVYSEGQNGHIKYHDLNLYVNSSSGNIISGFLQDQQYIFPTSMSQSISALSVSIMPSNGQELLGTNPRSMNRCSSGCQFNASSYSCYRTSGTGSCSMFERGGYTNTQSSPKNYIATGQGLGTEVVAYFDNRVGTNSNYFVNNGIYTGQSLSRYSLVDSPIYSELPDPRSLGSKVGYLGNDIWNFALDAEEELNGGNLYDRDIGSSIPLMNSDPYRFGEGGTGRREMGSAGEGETVNTIQTLYVKYMLSCFDRCQRKYLDAMRYMSISVPYIPHHLVGFNPEDHNETSIAPYRTRPFPISTTVNPAEDGTFCGLSRIRIQRTGQEYSPKDFLGYCDQTNNLQPHSLDYPVGIYGLSRQWTGWDDAHFGPNRLANYYEATGDMMAFHLFKSVTDPWASVFHNIGSLGGIRGQQRGQGRAMVAISELYRITKDPYYKRTLEFQPSLIELYTLNRDAVGARGTNPVTGDPFPVGFMGTKNDPAAINRHATGNTNVGVAWEDTIVDEGLYNIYSDITDNPLVLATIERIFDQQLIYLFQFAYKDPTEVRNGVSLTHALSGQSVPVAEGVGTFTQWTVVGPASGFPLQNFNDYTRFYHTDRFFYWMQYSMCGMIRDYSQDLTLKQKLKNAFESAYIYYLGGGDASQDWADRGLNLGSFEGYQLCSLTYLMNISTAVNQGSVCTDNDADGWSTCLGDCNDNNPNINPNVIERSALCSDNLDNNCNTLRDCSDAQCSNPTFGSSSCIGRSYCGNVITDSSLGEQCDVVPLNSVGANSCTEGRCVPAYSYSSGLNCLCSLGFAPPTLRNPSPTGRVSLTNPITIRIDTNVASTCKFDTRQGINYVSMQNTFSNTGGLTHSNSLTGLSEGEYTYYLKCNSTSNGLANTQDFTLRFTLDGTAPRIANPIPAHGSIISNTNALTIQTSVTDEYPLNLEVYLKKASDSGFNLVLQESLPAGSNVRSYTELPQRVSLENSLHAFYDFEGNTNDKSGKNNNPVTIQGSPVQGVFGTGRYFDGSQQQIISLGNIASTASNANLLQFTGSRELTLEGWIKPDLNQPGISNSPGNIPNVYLFGKKGDNQGYGLRLIQQNGNYFLRGVIGYPNSLGGQTRTVTSSVPVTLNQWHHVALVLKSIDGLTGDIKIYLDGQEVGSAPWLESASGLNNNKLTHTNSWSFTMGSPSRSSVSSEAGGSFSGIIDDVLVYNRSLSSSEIAYHSSQSITWPQGRYDWEVRASDGIFSVVMPYHFFMQSSGGTPAPILDSLNPSMTSTLPQTVQLIGNNFVSGATVLFNGLPLHSSVTTNFVSSSRIDINLPSNYPLGIYQVKIRNPDFQTSETLNLELQSSLGMPSCTLSSWQTTSSLSFSAEGAHDSAAAAYNNYMYLSGGQRGAIRPSNEIYRASIGLDGSLSSWSLLTTMPEGLQDHKMVINRNPSGIGATIYLIGGLADRGSGEVAVNNVSYAPILGDGTIGVWTAGPRLDFTTHGHDIAIVNNKMYKYGGGSGGAGINIVEYVNINNDGSLTGDGTNSWIRSAGQNLPVSRAYYIAGGPYPEWDVSGTGINPNKVYAIGGEDDSMCIPSTTPPINTNLDSVFIATPLSDGTINSWSLGVSLPEGRFDHSANFVKDSIIVVGGMNRPLHNSNTCPFQDATAKDTVFVARLDQNGNIVRWYDSSRLPSPRGDHTSVIYNDKIYVIGGRSTSLNGPYPSQVWYASLNCIPQSSSGSTTPNTPTGLTVSPINSSALRISWNDVAGENGYTLQYKLTSGSVFVNVPGASNLPANTVTFTHNGLLSGTSYDYRISAFNSAGNSPYSTPVSRSTNQTTPLDFSISRNPTFGSVQQGNTVTTTVTAIYVSGSSGTVTFAVTNLSAGVTASFNPSSCTPTSGSPCSSTLTLSASASATLVTSRQVVISGTSGSVVRNTTYNLTVVNVPVCSNGQVRNCGLQLGVCLNSFETCTNNNWPGCNYNSIGGYASVETGVALCRDGLDNDCDGTRDLGGDSGCPIPLYSRFNNNLTTNISNITDLTRVVNLSIGIPGLGRIQYLGQEVSLWRLVSGVYQSLNVNSAIVIENNLVGVYTESYPELNQTAIVTFYNLTYTTAPVPTVQTSSGFTICHSSKCNILSYNSSNGEFVMTTVGFSNYSTQVSTCGDSYCHALSETCSSCSADCGTCSSTGGSSGGSSGGSGGGGSGGSSRTVTSTIVTQCNDGIDNDGDNLIDYPEDLGCSNDNDNIELDETVLQGREFEEPTETLTPKNKDIQIGLVFWTFLLLLIGGIIVVLILLSRMLSIKKKINLALRK